MQLATTPEFRKSLQGDFEKEFHFLEINFENPCSGTFRFLLNSGKHHRIERLFVHLMVIDDDSGDASEITRIAVTHQSAHLLFGHDAIEFKPVRPPRLLHHNQWHWISFDPSLRMIKIGTGYAMHLNTLFQLRLDPKLWTFISPASTLKYLDCCDLVRLNPDPVTYDPPITLVHREEMTWDVLDDFSKVVPSTISPLINAMFDTISGKGLAFSNADVEAISYSLFSPGKLLFNVLKSKMKSLENVEPQSICIRCALGADEYERPKIPSFAIHIWPPTHVSPIIEYRETIGVSRLLCGQMNLEIYNPLVEKPTVPLSTYNIKPNDVTYFSPQIYQTHRYVNGDSVSVLLQYIRRMDGENERYVTENDLGYLNWVTPASDMRFKDVLTFVREEYQNDQRDGLIPDLPLDSKVLFHEKMDEMKRERKSVKKNKPNTLLFVESPKKEVPVARDETLVDEDQNPFYTSPVKKFGRDVISESILPSPISPNVANEVLSSFQQSDVPIELRDLIKENS